MISGEPAPMLEDKEKWYVFLIEITSIYVPVHLKEHL